MNDPQPNPTVDPEAPTPKTKLPWLVKSATFDQLSLTLALLEEQGYTPTLISPGGMIPDTRPGGGLMWCGSAYTVCGKLKEAPIVVAYPITGTIQQGIDLVNEYFASHPGRQLLPIPVNPQHVELTQQLREATADHVMTPPEKAPSLPVQPKGKGKK